MTVYRGRIQLLAKPASEWTAENPVLLNGEFGVSDPTTSAPIVKVGDGVRPWSTLPGIAGGGGGSAPNYVVGSTTTLPPGSFATVEIDNTAIPPAISFGIPTGATGPANSLAIGTVTTGTPGSPAAATITGTPPAQVLSLTIPRGAQGAQGDAGADGATGVEGPPGATGPANVLTIGTVTTGAPGDPAAAAITGTTPAQVLNLTIPTGAAGPVGPTGPVGPSGPAGSTTLADPTGVIGLTAVNGSSAFAIRSDGSPPLSQAIAPTWTGAHSFTQPVTVTGDHISLVNTDAYYELRDSGGAADQKVWWWRGTANQMAFQTRTDAGGLGQDILRITRSGAAVQTIFIGNATGNPSYSILGTGTATFNGTVDLLGPLHASSVAGVSGQVLSSRGAGLAPEWRTSAGGSIELGYNFSVSVGTANPGSQKMSLNSAVYSAVTVAVFNSLAFTNFDANTILSLLTTGHRIYIQQRNDSSKAVVYEVTGPGTDNTGYWTIPVRYIDSRGTIFPANADLNCVFILSVSGSSFANPTASVGLTAVNGVATTGMRSDAAPALAVNISPQWTGTHAFTATPLLVGTATSLSVGNTSGLQQFGTVIQGASHSITRGGNDANNPRLAFGKTRSTTYDGLTPVQSGDVLGQIAWFGADGTNLNTAGAQIVCNVTGTVATGVIPGDMRFSVASAAGTMTERFRISNFGGLGVAGGNYGTAGQVLTSGGNAAAPTWAAVALAAANLANPSATIGLTAVNGSALTAMRSDGAPALSQAIVPTWTGAHTFNAPATFTALASSTCPLTVNGFSSEWALKIINAAPTAPYGILITAGDATAASMFVRRGDAGNRALLVVAGNGLQFGNPTDNPPYDFYGSGITNFGGIVNGAGGFRSDNGFTNIGATKQIIPNGGALTYGSFYVTGAVGGYHGMVIYDGGLNPGLMSDNANAGIYLQGEAKWLFYRSSSTQAISQYNWTTPAFATSTASGGHMGAGTINATAYYVNGVALSTGGTPANPSASVGLSAVNGSASTYMRSDAAPPLSQAIAPTWSGAHMFTGATTGLASIGVSPGSRASLPAIGFSLSTAGADSKVWELIATATGFYMRSMNDAYSLNKDFLVASKVGNVITNVALGNTTDNPSYSFNGSGLATFGGSISASNATLGGVVTVSAALSTQLRLIYPGAPSNTSTTTLGVVGGDGSFRIQSVTDATPSSPVTALIQGNRTGTAWTGLLFGNNTDNPQFNFLGTGAVVCSGAVSAPSFTSTSARAVKRETGAPRFAADILARLRPILYRLLAGNDSEQLGLIAEEVQEVCPQLSNGSTVSYDRLAILLLAAWQDEHTVAA